MNEEPEPPSLPALILEHVDPELVGVDVGPGGAAATERLTECVAVLAWAGVDAQKTRLVVTGDFIQSVRDRGDSEYHANYNMRRNVGIVGGKTIAMPDATVDVLVPAAMFLIERDEDEASEIERLATRTVLHEAQHVLIQQAGESGSSFEGQAWARRNLLVAADQVIEEYRAEAVCARLAVGSGWPADLDATLETWLADLQRITCREYQVHLDAGRLAYDILQETHTVWNSWHMLLPNWPAVRSYHARAPTTPCGISWLSLIGRIFWPSSMGFPTLGSAHLGRSSTPSLTLSPMNSRPGF